MLRLELSDRRYNKTEHRLALMERLNNRSNSSVELKHQNISAVLIDMGIPYIDGYKPRFNYQRSLLPAAIVGYLKNYPEMQDLFEADSEAIPPTPAVEDVLDSLEQPPVLEERKPSILSEPRPVYKSSSINYLEREARNKSLGDAGEQFVMSFERARLVQLGREALADRIEQVSETVGPYAGYDVRSFDADGADRFIEAKTTKYGKSTPFFVTPNELRFSREKSSRYFLYRVFKYGRAPRLFTLHGRLEDKCILEPSVYIARPV